MSNSGVLLGKNDSFDLSIASVQCTTYKMFRLHLLIPVALLRKVGIYSEKNMWSYSPILVLQDIGTILEKPVLVEMRLLK